MRERHGARVGRKRRIVMVTFERKRLAALLLLTAAGTFSLAGMTHAAEDGKRSPWAVFKFGFSAYKKGDKNEAVKAYRYAAEQGHAGANWKLGRMYADGDGVNRDDYQAYRFFEQVVRKGAEQGSPDETYFADSLVALAGYLQTGIPNTPVKADPGLAQDLYLQAATIYGDARAQFEIGRMMLDSAGRKSANNVRQAARWLGLATEKGHAGAQALLGNLLFQSGKSVRGLAMMTAALERSQPVDRPWILKLQEEAFAVSPEADRRTAIALSEDILRSGDR